LRAAALQSTLSLPQMMHVLTEHFRRDQGDTAVGNEETLAILQRIDADLEPRGQYAIPVDDAVFERDVAIHLDIGKDHRILDVAIAAHVNNGEQQLAPHP